MYIIETLFFKKFKNTKTLILKCREIPMKTLTVLIHDKQDSPRCCIISWAIMLSRPEFSRLIIFFTNLHFHIKHCQINKVDPCKF